MRRWVSGWAVAGLICLGGGISGLVHAQALKLDAGFAPLLTTVQGARLSAVVSQPDGNLLVVGNFDVFHGHRDSGVTRLGLDGTRDPEFSTAGSVGGAVTCAALQADGRILIGGTFGRVRDLDQRAIARLKADGTVDPSFRPSLTGPDGFEVSVIRVESEGGIVLGGNFRRVAGVPRQGIARLHPDGSLDEGFEPGQGVEDSFGRVLDVALGENGWLWIAGYFTKFDGYERPGLVALDNEGRVIESFAPHLYRGVGLPGVTVVRRQPDGRIVIAGAFDRVESQPRFGIARLEADGELDESFAVHGGFQALEDAPVRDLLVLPEGKILVAGRFDAVGDRVRVGLARLDPDGTLDEGFDADPGVSWADGSAAAVSSIAALVDGRLIVAGAFDRIGGQPRHLLARCSPDGAPDPTFSTAHALVERAGNVNVLETEPDGAVVVGGDFERANGVRRDALARFLPDGRLDEAFDAVLEPGSRVNALAWHADGRLLVGGRFDGVQGEACENLACFGPDGRRDGTFGVAGGPNGEVYCLRTEPSGRILIGGDFDHVGDLAQARLARVDAHGIPDPTFLPVLGHRLDLPEAYALAVRADGRIVVGGYFDSMNHEPRANLTQLRADGTLDPEFAPALDVNGSLPLVLWVGLTREDRVLAGGSFQWVNGQSRRGVVRLLPDGLLDPEFDPGQGVSGSDLPAVNAGGVLPGGRTVLGGEFTQFNGQPRRNLVWLDASGRPEAGSGSDPAVNGWINALAVLSDGGVVLGGNFTSVGGSPRSAVARYSASGGAGHLSIQRRADRVAIAWSVSGQLQSSFSVNGPWTNVGDTKELLLETDAAGPARFFRLVP